MKEEIVGRVAITEIMIVIDEVVVMGKSHSEIWNINFSPKISSHMTQ